MEINPSFSKPRLIFLFSTLVAVLLAVIWGYARHMLGPQEFIPGPRIRIERGSILDRNGKLLAVQTTMYNIGISRTLVTDPLLYAQILAPLTSIPESEILTRLTERPGNFFYLKRRITPSEKSTVETAVRDAQLRGVRLEPVVSRTYPEGSLASHVIGFVGDDGKGLSGIEFAYQDMLSPPARTVIESTNGANIKLTIDAKIQHELEKLGRETMQSSKAEGLILIAANAKTGEILAYVSEPAANLNEYASSSISERYDRPALYAFEPGSVFKIFSVAAFMDLNMVNDRDRFYCDTSYQFTTGRGEQITINCLVHHGWVTPRDAIRLSCNEGPAQMSERASNAEFESKLRAFGFGSRTGIQLPGETAGIFRAHNQWSLRSKPTIAIGQEIAVSALQMVQAATALTNAGTTLKLTLLSRVYSYEGIPLYTHQPVQQNTVLRPETATLMLNYMQSASESGTGIRAAVGDVPIAVKTGTAQMLSPLGGYSTTDFISSCIGIFPVEDPQIILYTAIIKPVGETFGGRIAAPVISTAANFIIDYLGIRRSGATSVRHTGLIALPRNRPVEIGNVMPDLHGISKRMLTPLLDKTDIQVLLSGNGYVIRQTPAPGTPLQPGMVIELVLE